MAMDCAPGKAKSSPYSVRRPQPCWPFLVVIPVSPTIHGLAALTAGLEIVTPVPLSAVPSTDTVAGQDPAPVVPTSVPPVVPEMAV